MYNQPVDIRLADSLGFVPTSTGPRWRGKFKCNFCNNTGYVEGSFLLYRSWWGHRHGNNCNKQFV